MLVGSSTHKELPATTYLDDMGLKVTTNIVEDSNLAIWKVSQEISDY
jgi:hypothetical protein